MIRYRVVRQPISDIHQYGDFPNAQGHVDTFKSMSDSDEDRGLILIVGYTLRCGQEN